MNTKLISINIIKANRLSITFLVCALFSCVNGLGEDGISAKKIRNDSAKINKLLELSEKLVTSNHDEAHQMANEALKLSTKSRNNTGIARSLSIIGDVYLNQSDYFEARKYYEQSLEYFQKNNDKDGMAGSFENLGNSFEIHGNYSEAIKSYEQAYIIYQQLNDKKSLASACNNLGVLYYLVGKPELAFNKYSEAQNILLQLEDSLKLSQIFINKGHLFLETKQLDSASHYYNASHQFVKKEGNTHEVSESYIHLAKLYVDKNDYYKAISYADNALLYAEKNQHHELVCKALIIKGTALQLSHNYPASIKTLQKCREIAEIFSLPQELKESSLLLSGFHAENKNYKDAFYNFKLYEQVNSKQQQTNSFEKEAEAFIYKQQQENKILRLERDQEKRKLQLAVLGGVFLIILISFIFIVVIIRIKQKSTIDRIVSTQQKIYFNTALEAQEKERKRIASDLHDSVGQMLSLIKLNVSELNDSICSKSEEYEDLLKRSLTIIDKACTEVRTISHNLMPGSLISLGLIPASRDLIRTINESTNINVTLETQINGQRFEEKIEIAFFRILQELINNSIKHSNASDVVVNFSLTDNKLKMTIKDNGIGFDINSANKGNGIGWKNINSRLSVINGQLNINSEKNWKSVVSVSASAK